MFRVMADLRKATGESDRVKPVEPVMKKACTSCTHSLVVTHTGRPVRTVRHLPGKCCRSGM